MRNNFQSPRAEIKKSYFKGKTFFVELKPGKYLDDDKFTIVYNSNLINPNLDYIHEEYEMKQNGLTLSIRKRNMPNNFVFCIRVWRSEDNGRTYQTVRSEGVLFADANIKEVVSKLELLRTMLADLSDEIAEASLCTQDCECGCQNEEINSWIEDAINNDEDEIFSTVHKSLSKQYKDNLSKLRLCLQQAVNNENYELAAKIRDEIKQHEK